MKSLSHGPVGFPGRCCPGLIEGMEAGLPLIQERAISGALLPRPH